MAEKKIKTRIQQKHDIEANWKLAKNFIPMAGELIIYDVDANYTYERFKIGDGETLVNDLPFINEHTHTTTYTPAGTVSTPDFLGTQAWHSHEFSGSASHNHTFIGTSATHDHSFLGAQVSHDHTFTGTGTMIKGTFTGTEQTASVDYTPAGSVSTPTITVTPNTTTVNSITAVGTLPALTYSEKKASKITAWSAGTSPSLTFAQGSLPSANLSGGSASLTGAVSTGPNRTVTLTHSHSNPTLSFSAGALPTATFNAGTVPSLTYETAAASEITNWSAGSLPTKGGNTTVVTGIKNATSTQPAFTGTTATISHKHTPSGSVTITTAAPTSGETANYTPVGTVEYTMLTYVGTIQSTSLTPIGTVGSTEVSINGTTEEAKIVPAGLISKPTFTGTEAIITTSEAEYDD